MNVVFFNYWHNGDCFVSKGWVEDIMSKLPEAKFYYAHNLHPEILKDLNIEHIPLDNIQGLHTYIPIAKSDNGDIFINTWCGLFVGDVFPHGEHSNFIRQHEIYKRQCFSLSSLLEKEIIPTDNPLDYIPSINFSYFDTGYIDTFINSLNGKKIILICNNPCKSDQSDIGDLRDVVISLTKLFPNFVFITTKELDINMENVYNTNKIFNKSSDLNEIAYLSKFTNIIIGNNSGPYTFTHFKENLFDKTKTFICLSKKFSDYPPYGLDLPCKIIFSELNETEELIKFLTVCINKNLE
jgi:hypothetical protein